MCKNILKQFLVVFVGLFILVNVAYASHIVNTNFITGFVVADEDSHEHDNAMESDMDEHSMADMMAESAFDKSQLTVFMIFIFLVIGFGVIFLAWCKTHGFEDGKKIDLLDFPFIKKLVKSKLYPLIIQIPVAAVFLFVIYVGIFDTQDGGKSLATILTWLIWWTFLIFTIVLLGRVWCMACPFQFFGDIAQKLFCLKKKIPHKFRNLWISVFGFLFLTWGFAYWNIGGNPLATAIMSIVIILGSIIISMIFIKRTFCRNFCPIGGLIGIYSMIAPVELTVKEKNKIPPCQNACPVSQNVKGYMSLIASNKLEQAAELIRRDNALPSVCGRVCDHPCEIECTRNDLEKEPISIKTLKRVALDYVNK